jgi:lactoylglutathione lyase
MRLEHTGLVVQDMDKAVAFYRDVLGLRIVRRLDAEAPATGDHTAFQNAHRLLILLQHPDGGHTLELVKYLHPSSPGSHLDRHQLGVMHLCFSVDDLDRIYKELTA